MISWGGIGAGVFRKEDGFYLRHGSGISVTSPIAGETALDMVEMGIVPLRRRYGDPHVPLSIVLTSAALLLALPLGLILFLLSFRAIGPWRRGIGPVRLPDLPDDECGVSPPVQVLAGIRGSRPSLHDLIPVSQITGADSMEYHLH